MSWMSPLTVPIGLREERAQDGHPGLHRVGGEQHLRHEQDAVAEILADDAHALHEGLGQDVVGRPPAREQDPHALLYLLLEAVIEVVVHLLHEVVVAKRVEVDFVRHGR